MTKKLDVFPSAHSFHEDDVRDKVVVMIDVLRASSTIAAALQNGAKGVIPAGDMETAAKIAQNLDFNKFLLSGEKNGIKIESFHLGNSPLEHSPETVKGKTIILNTTNGTKAIKRAAKAKKILVGSFLNLAAVVDYLEQIDDEAVLVCAGWRGHLSFEDLLCAGNIIYEITSGRLPEKARDGTKTAFGLFEKFGDDIEKAVKSSDYAERLREIVSEDDLSFCCQVSKTRVLPAMNEGIITDFNG
ncbi:MAG TPA: 2-phosphosulfolactate phosphatase, partial [Balneolaceae bacterium]|nr:2-phosphosulfolactate phosphatase [Balneolaceae bacterium]